MIETSFCELRKKEVVNLDDGRRLGKFTDVIFELQSGKVVGFCLPGTNKILGIFKTGEDIFVPYQSILKIGDDVILIELSGAYSPSVMKTKNSQNNTTNV